MTAWSRRDELEGRLLDVGGRISLRAEADSGSDPRAVDGILFPFDAPTRRGATEEWGSAAESFAPGAFRDWIAGRARPVPIIDRHGADGGVVVGVADHWEERTEASESIHGDPLPPGLYYRGRLLTSQAARDYAERALAGVNGVSGEFLRGAIRRTAALVTHVRVQAIGAVAGAYIPAYAGATVSIRESGGHVMEHCEHCGAELTAGVGHECAQGTAARAAAGAQAGTGTGFAGRQAVIPGVPGAVAGEVPMTQEAIARLVRDTTDEVVRRHAERGTFAGRTGADPWADVRGFTSLGELVRAASADDATPELVRWASRALADQLTTDNNAGVTTPGIVGDIRRLVDRGRPAITAFGGPRPLEGTGLTFSYPYYDGTLSSLVGEQTTQKTQVTSAKVEIKAGSVTIKTYAGGSDIAYQLIRRSSPAYLDLYARIMLAAWGLVTNAAFVTALEAGSVTVDLTEALTAVDANELKGWLIDAAVAVDLATGSPAEFALAGTGAFKAAAKLLNPGPVFNAVGQMSIRNLEVNVGGLPIIHDPAVTDGKFIVSSRQAAAWHEEGPFQATAEDVAKLGRDVAYWSMGAAAVYVPAAVVEVYDVTP